MARNSGDMSSLSFEDDPRPACKYGLKCYQKNQVHLRSFKHPVNLKRDHQDDTHTADSKKQKRDVEDSDTSSDDEHQKDDISEYSDSDADSRPPKKESATAMQIDTDENGASSKRETISDSSDSETSMISNSPEPEKQEEKKKSSVIENVEKTLVISPQKPNSLTNESATWNKTIKEKFLVEMPLDFFEFWNFCKSLNNSHPADALKPVGLTLVGPYDVLAGNLNEELPTASLLVHWRYYYDPPEFQTVLRGDDKTLFHVGYFRDDPKAAPCFLASNAAAKGCTITPMGDNIFSAVNSYVESTMKTVTPFLKMKYVSVQKSIQAWAKNCDFSLSTNTPSMKSRQRNIVTKSFHGAGIVVPVEKRTQLGYRELLETDARLKKILKLIVDSESEKEVVRDLCFSKLDPVITAANIANDECDFGTSLELGIDLFCFGGKTLEAPALPLLITAYTLLRRPEFAQIIKAHLANRREGSKLSVL